MFRVQTFLSKSRIAGTGVFAGQDIKKNQEVWVFDNGLDRLLHVEDLICLPEEQKIYVLEHAFLNEHGAYKLPIDDFKYLNHSSDPNTTNADSKIDCIIALRDIQEGEELTCHYHIFNLDGESEIERIVLGRALDISYIFSTRS